MSICTQRLNKTKEAIHNSVLSPEFNFYPVTYLCSQFNFIMFISYSFSLKSVSFSCLLFKILFYTALMTVGHLNQERTWQSLYFRRRDSKNQRCLRTHCTAVWALRARWHQRKNRTTPRPHEKSSCQCPIRAFFSQGRKSLRAARPLANNHPPHSWSPHIDFAPIPAPANLKKRM